MVNADIIYTSVYSEHRLFALQVINSAQPMTTVVAVRARPISSKEKAKGEKSCIQISDNAIKVTGPSVCEEYLCLIRFTASPDSIFPVHNYNIYKF